jgi:hypothetical protein
MAKRSTITVPTYLPTYLPAYLLLCAAEFNESSQIWLNQTPNLDFGLYFAMPTDSLFCWTALCIFIPSKSEGSPPLASHRGLVFARGTFWVCGDRSMVDTSNAQMLKCAKNSPKPGGLKHRNANKNSLNG